MIVDIGCLVFRDDLYILNQSSNNNKVYYIVYTSYICLYNIIYILVQLSATDGNCYLHRVFFFKRVHINDKFFREVANF